MSRSVLFFEPVRLPLTADVLSSEDSTAWPRSFTDPAVVKATLTEHLSHLVWDPNPDAEHALARGTLSDDGGVRYELSVAMHQDGSEEPGLIVSLRGPLRVDSTPLVQRICDATGWVAFDEVPNCYQPHHPPFFAGGEPQD